MWNKSISLPTGKIISQDAAGFPSKIHEFVGEIPANFTDVTRDDEILAEQKGYTVNQNIEIMKCNYDSQTWLYDEETGDIYDVRRAYTKDKSMTIILSCERRERRVI